PCGPHAHPGASRGLGPECLSLYLGYGHQIVAFHLGVVPGGLWTVPTVLRTASRLDREQGGYLYRIGVVVFPMDRGRPIEQLHHRKIVQFKDFRPLPVMSDIAHRFRIWG